jgi:hypothetical protein
MNKDRLSHTVTDNGSAAFLFCCGNATKIFVCGITEADHRKEDAL